MITWDWSYYWPNFTERYVLPATMLNECQIYLGDGGRRPSPRYIGNQDGCPILTILRKKKGDCEQHWGKHAQKPKLAI